MPLVLSIFAQGLRSNHFLNSSWKQSILKKFWDTLQTSSRHPPDFFHTPISHPQSNQRIMPLWGPTCKIARFQAELKFSSWTRVWQSNPYCKWRREASRSAGARIAWGPHIFSESSYFKRLEEIISVSSDIVHFSTKTPVSCQFYKPHTIILDTWRLHKGYCQAPIQLDARKYRVSQNKVYLMYTIL